MRNKEVIKGLNAVIGGLQDIVAAIEADESGSDSGNAMNAPVSKPAIGGAKKAPATVASKPAIGKSAPKSEPAPSNDGQTYTTDELVAMKYNDFKKLAASLGVDCKGTRDEIMARVVETGVVTDAEGGEAPAKSTPATAKSAPAAKGGLSAGTKKLGAKKPAEPVRDEFDEQAEEVAKETPVKDIIAALADVDIKATKANAVTLLAGALRDGLISLSDDEEENGEEAGEETTAEQEDGDIDANSYFPDYDPDGLNNPDTMTDARAEAVVEKMDDIITEISEGNLTQDDMVDFLQTICTQDELDLLGDDYSEEDIIALYMEMQKRLIDNNGEEHEPGSDPYEIGEENICCGHILAYDKKKKVFICDRCAAEYSAE